MNTTPIKFMAWDKTLLKMKGIGGLTDMFNIRNDGMVSSNGGEYEIMQFTALRSINDEPIYNHMIVRDEFGEYRLVDMFNYRKMSYLSDRELAIVGNRFQSPELLKLCK